MQHQNPSPTKMVNPPKTETKMTDSGKVKIKALYPIRYTGADGSPTEAPIGSVVEVSPEEAEMFCEQNFNIGQRDHFGYNAKPKGVEVVRAERV